MADKFDIGTLDRMYRENITDPLNNGVRGYFGFDPKTAGSEAYRIGQALSNMPAVGMPAKAAKAVAETPEILNTLGMFVGKASKSWDKRSNELAKQMQAKGETPEKIWDLTGNIYLPDKQWRQEISDKFARFFPYPKQYEHLFGAGEGRRIDPSRKVNNLIGDRPVALGENLGVIDPSILKHDELYKAYDPSSLTSGLTIDKLSNSSAAFSPKTKQVYLDANYSEYGPLARGHLLHELQHAVQLKEGFAKGAGASDALKPENFALFQRIRQEVFNKTVRQPRDPKISDDQIFKKINDDAIIEFYKRHLGEVEARATEKRMNFNERDLAARFPGLDYDVPTNKLIIKQWPK